MPQQDPWAAFPVVGQAAPQQAPPQAPRYPGIVQGPPKQPDPVAVQNANRGDASEARQAAANTWRVLTPEEATQMGLPPGGSYRINGLGKPEAVVAPPKGSSDPVRNAQNLLTSAGVDLLSPEDRVADLIRGSTSGGLQKFGAELYGDITGDATEGMENIGKLKAIAADLTLQMTGGSLGNQISNADREFIMERMGNLGDASVPAEQRLAAWEEVRGRLARTLGIELPEKANAREGMSREDALAYTVSRWGGEFYDEGGNPLGPDGGPGYNKNGEYVGLFGQVTDETPAAPDSTLDQLGIATAVDAKGIAKMATGLFDTGMDAAGAVRTGVNQVIGKGGGALLDAVGAEGAADWWRQGSEGVQQNINNIPTASGALDNIYPTPRGYEAGEFASTLAASLMLPGPKRANVPRAPGSAPAIPPSSAREVIKAGKDAGVRVMTTDVVPPKTFIGKTVQAVGERIPVAGTGGPRAAQQQERVQAVRDLARDFGADIAGEYLDEIADDLARTRGGQIAGFTRAKDAVIDGVEGAFTAPRTVQAIDAQVARLRGINEGAFAPVIRQLEAFKANIVSGKTLRQVEGNRKLLGDMFEDPNLASIKSDGQKALNAIYGPLREDMAAFIRVNAGEQAVARWSKANERLAALAGELDSAAFRNVLKNAETTPEAVGRLLFNRSPSEVRRLYRNLSSEGQAKARAGIIAMAVGKAGGLEAISPDLFANAIARNSKAAGVVFEGADLARLQGLERLLQATKRASVASAAPPTGAQNMPLIGAFAAGASGPVSIPVLASMGGIARLYESPATRNLLVGLSKTQPGSPAESKWIERILKAAAPQTERIGNAANDVVSSSPSRVAATENE